MIVVVVSLVLLILENREEDLHPMRGFLLLTIFQIMNRNY